MRRYPLPILLIFALILPFCAFSQNKQKAKKSKKDYLFTLHTAHGDILFVLYDETPKHKANFLALTQAGFYDGTLFHRVINNFMIQGGDPATKPDGKAVPMPRSPQDWNDENSVEAEILAHLKHHRGAVAAARMGDQVNPEKRSSKSQFYIVHNKNGTPHLDGGYTVFGKVLKGMDVVDKIAGIKTGEGNRPVKDIPMKISVKRMNKKKIARMTATK